MSSASRVLCVLAAGGMLLCACAPATVARGDTAAGTATTLGGDKRTGAEIFAVNCATCHGANGEGGPIGVSLRGENMRMSFGGTVSWIEDPQPPMPKLYPQFLTRAQVRDLAAYVDSL